MLAFTRAEAQNAGFCPLASDLPSVSNWDGGKPGVSDTLGSALWAAHMMLTFAQGSRTPVHLHGGGNGYYTPIAASVRDGFTRGPSFTAFSLPHTLLAVHC